MTPTAAFFVLLLLFGLGSLLLPLSTLDTEQRHSIYDTGFFLNKNVPFYVLNPSAYRHYFPDKASFDKAAAVAPFIDLDSNRYDEILTTYYYRIRSYRKHIVKTTTSGNQSFWVVTEFIPPVPWAGTGNTISGGVGHHILEGRWFWDAPVFIDDYIRFWYIGESGGLPQEHIDHYTNWIYHATWQYALLWGLEHVETTRRLIQDTFQNAANVFSNTYVPKYLTNSTQNSPVWNTTGRVCWRQEDDPDAMEVSVSGGGCRPTIASAMWGEAMALYNAANLLDDEKTAQEFWNWAHFSQQVVEHQHWNPSIQSFAVISPPNQQPRKQKIHYNGNRRSPKCNLTEIRTPNKPVNVRELLAFMPWYFSSLIAPDNPNATIYASQFQWLLKKTGNDGFTAKWGLRTVQRSSPCYNYSWEHGDCWNGPSWPYETSRVLTGLANLLTEHKPATIEESGMNTQIFYDLLHQYARQHTATYAVNDTAHPLHSGHVFENLHPDEGYWNNRARMYWRNDSMKNMGDDYNHSTFIDLILSCWLGIRTPTPGNWLVIHPLIQTEHFAADRIPYRGRVLSIVYDPTGTRYPMVSGVHGFTVLVDGVIVAQRSNIGRLILHKEPPIVLTKATSTTRH